ncbi:hypothetical protein [Bacillus sp. OTU530]|uniref:hypothetical protein n=1 Tax=Bacillus sp. OTU530 TaxID=3043862 RepID=UPI00313E91A8
MAQSTNSSVEILNQKVSELNTKISDSNKNFEIISAKFEGLKEVVDAWQQTVQFNLVLTWTILGIVLTLIIGAAGWALSVLSKSWAERAINSKINDIKKDIKESLTKEIEEQSRTYTFTIAAGATIKVPYEEITKGQQPVVFVRVHDEGAKHAVKIEEGKISIENEEPKALSMDLMILKAKISL